MAQLYLKKRSDGLPKAVEGTDDGELYCQLEGDDAGALADVKAAVEALAACISAGKVLVDTTGLATQTTLAAILAKIIAAPATEANQALIKAAVDAVTAKLSSDPATATLQGTGNASLANIAKRYSQNTNLKIDFASVAAQTIIAAPAAGSRIVIQSIFLTCLVNNIVVMTSGSTEIGKAYVYGFSKDYISGLILGTAEAFKLQATTADPIYGQVCYYVEVV